MAVTQNRLKATNFFKITDTELFKKVTQEDRDKANVIRDYYHKKFTFIGLTSSNQTKSGYRQELLGLLKSDGKKIRENVFGVAFWLPVFYEYDLQRDSVKQQVLIKGCSTKYGKMKNENIKVFPLKRVHRKTKRTNFYEYWFKTEENYPFVIHTNVDNNLLGMLEYFFNKKQPITLGGNVYTKTLDNFEYLSINSWTIVEA